MTLGEGEREGVRGSCKGVRGAEGVDSTDAAAATAFFDTELLEGGLVDLGFTLDAGFLAGEAGALSYSSGIGVSRTLGIPA